MDKCYADKSTEAASAALEVEPLRAVKDAAILACQQLGAPLVRKAARDQLNGDSLALGRVGLGGHQYFVEHILEISNIAFARMTDKEIHAEFCADINMEPWLFP